MWGYMHGYNGGWGMGWGWLGIPLMLLFWGGLILGIFALVRYLAGGRGASSRVDPVDILKERYARGEISLEEYEERKLNLKK